MPESVENYTEVVRADAGTYRRELVAQIKTAYYNYLETLKLEDVSGKYGRYPAREYTGKPVTLSIMRKSRST